MSKIKKMKKLILILMSLFLLLSCSTSEHNEGSLNVPDMFHGNYQVVDLENNRVLINVIFAPVEP